MARSSSNCGRSRPIKERLSRSRSMLVDCFLRRVRQRKTMKSKSGRRKASSSSSYSLRQLTGMCPNCFKGELRAVLPNPTKSRSWRCIFSRDENVIFVAHHNGSIIRRKLDDRTYTEFKAHSTQINALAINNDGELMLLLLSRASTSNQLYLINQQALFYSAEAIEQCERVIL